MKSKRRYVVRTHDGWDGVEHEGYASDAPANVVRHTLIGGRKTDGSIAGPQLEVRYFEVPAGSVTRLEKHEHEHYVIVGQGIGQAVVGETVREIRQHDVVYVGPLEPHQFINRGAETFGFFCIVTAERDFPQLLSADETAALAASPAGAVIDPDGAPLPRHLREAIKV